MKKIVYIGNNLAKKTNYFSAMEMLALGLKKNNFQIILSSDKENKILRILEMCFVVYKNRKTSHVILIDTFSTINFYYALIISQLCRLLGLKYIPILHGGNLPYRLKKNSFLSKLLFNNSYINVSPSNYLKSEFESHGFKIKYIPNAISIDNYNFRLRKLYRPKLLWVRAFDKTYNPIMAIEVVKDLTHEFKNIDLCMVGPFKDTTIDDVKRLIEDYNLQDNIKITGVLPKEKWHQLSIDYDIFINTTTIDNMPVSVIEAMALGLPVISTNVGGIPYLINNKVDGLLVENNNVKEMTNQIRNLMNNPEKGQKITLNARKKVENYDTISTMKEWIKLLNSI
ncbi:glycosyltransferase family 4 protein [Lutibacter sp. TH_r2]|uniref:glycosyltransferase family 4 protein n=1 Tax=Lutibacter sp. TH_r2 TaxID=3082083 RepID=UPI002953921B|nr:glycosyltransferase family 4 protein [Lutibacter sp. TH_r2]MDV7187459.1 glycosyltransferase family 4 protein [Lutibacter sp. TH_r2]